VFQTWVGSGITLNFYELGLNRYAIAPPSTQAAWGTSMDEGS